MQINYILNSLPTHDEYKLRTTVDKIINECLYIEDGVKYLNQDFLINLYQSISNKNSDIKQSFFNLFAYKIIDELIDTNFINYTYEKFKKLESSLHLVYQPLNNPNNSISLKLQQTHLALATTLYHHSHNQVNLIDMLIKKGAKAIYEGSNALLYATKYDDEPLVEKYLILGANPTLSRGDILGNAIKNGSFNILEKFRINQKKTSIEKLIIDNKENVLYFMVKNYLLMPNHNLNDEKNEKIFFNTILHNTPNVEKFKMQKEKNYLENSMSVKFVEETKKINKKMKI
jgi:hypothetical protein